MTSTQEREAEIRGRLEKNTSHYQTLLETTWQCSCGATGAAYTLPQANETFKAHRQEVGAPHGWNRVHELEFAAHAPADLAWALERIDALENEIDVLRAARIRRVDDLLSDLREPLTLADVRKLRDGLTLESNDYHRQVVAAKGAAKNSPAGSPVQRGDGHG